MAMDPCFRELSEIFNSVNLRLGDDHDSPSLLPCFRLNEPLVEPYMVNLNPIVHPPDTATSLVLHTSSTVKASIHRGDGSSEGNGACLDKALNDITKTLMEDDLDDKLCTYLKSSALQAAEKSLYEAIGEEYPSAESSLEDYGISQLFDTYDSSCSIYDNGNFICVGGDNQLSSRIYGSSLECYAFESSYGSSSSIKTNDRLGGSPTTTLAAIPDFFRQELGIFNNRVEGTTGYYPKCVDSVNHMERIRFLGEEVLIKVEENEFQYVAKESRVKKNMCREDLDSEKKRSNKHAAAAYNAKDVGSEVFDKVLLSKKGNPNSSSALDEWCDQVVPADRVINLPTIAKVRRGGNSRSKKHGKHDVVDLRDLLISCAQAIGNDDHRNANELLKRIKQHSTPTGDGNERLAQVFVDALEARLAGKGSEIYRAMTGKKTAADILKAYHLYISACPFKKLAHFFSNQTILDVLGNKTKLHIVDIGIFYGFQWPCFLQLLSLRPGGPPKLKITGIDLPESGFRPAERVEESGRRLAEYAQRFNVPFKYFALARKWETIRVEDINVEEDEVLVVNCLLRLKNLFDETVDVSSPRNIVLNTIKRLKPDVFIHGEVNGAYSAPYFLTRFKEALFHYSALFDILEAQVPRKHPERMAIEKSIFGRDVMNIISCEGTERIERPETYKQWQVRNTRAGFVQLPLSPYILNRSREKSRGCHKDFVIDKDGEWILQGWKGRIVYAFSSWK